YGLLAAISMVPIMGALALAIDYTELSKQRAQTMNALDAAGIATARFIASGSASSTDQAVYETAVKKYAKDFFEANLGSVDPDDTELTVLLPNNNFGGGTLKLTADMTYHPRFLPAAAALINKVSSEPNVNFTAEAEIRLKNTLEVALVLDNSGSMDEYGFGTSKKRIDLLKEASKELVNKLAQQASQMKQVDKPVQFALVPFSASVNIAPSSDDKPWMDTTGISPIHHENFDWSKMTEANKAQLGDRWAQKVGDVWYKRGAGWGETENQPLTRFSLYSDMLAETDREEIPDSRRCIEKKKNGTCKTYAYDYTYTTSEYASWQGCVEARPYPYNTDDTTPGTGNPATLYVPMFAPDEAGNRWKDLNHDGTDDLSAGNSDYGYSTSWWADWELGNTGVLNRQQDARKYFRVKPYGSSTAGSGYGPNFSCTTSPITPLTDVTVVAGKDDINAAIDAMKPTGNTNVPEGTARGWRVLSSNEPFIEGRGNTEKGNDKVVIVLTDGANTYGDQGGDDNAGNKSTYAAYGYAGHKFAATETTSRLYKGTSTDVSKTTYTASNYQKALDEQMRKICTNAKNANVLVMTVSLDLDATKTAEAKAITELKNCSSDSRFRKDEDGNPKKLFWNATGATLSTVFKEIADELSNLRIVG
ncbi:MAG TPA: pilus assembly protein TadG-related protein, partial [Burkholderiaceae bacterium]|nr:pilus assembly protein TadG-related protein [Burkholderiaceae bacterium]